MHILALDALLAVVQSVEGHCHSQLLNTVDKAIEETIADGTPKKKKEKTGIILSHGYTFCLFFVDNGDAIF